MHPLEASAQDYVARGLATRKRLAARRTMEMIKWTESDNMLMYIVGILPTSVKYSRPSIRRKNR